MQFPIKSHRELNVSRTQFLLNLTNNFYIGIIISIVFIIRHNNDVLYKPRELCPKGVLKLSLVHAGRQVLFRTQLEHCLGRPERNHLRRYCRGTWKCLKVKSSVRGQLTFIDFLHHLVGIKINCSFYEVSELFRCPCFPPVGTGKGSGGVLCCTTGPGLLGIISATQDGV